MWNKMRNSMGGTDTVKAMIWHAQRPQAMFVFAVCTLWQLFKARDVRITSAVCGAVVVLLCWADYQSFHLIFIHNGLYDPVSAPLLFMRELVPGGG